jgi:hypothetical protein
MDSTLVGAGKSLDGIVASTSTFLAAGIREDMPTGETPRKKAWNVPASWERTGPRQVLIDGFRRRKAGGIDEVGPGETEVEQPRAEPELESSVGSNAKMGDSVLPSHPSIEVEVVQPAVVLSASQIRAPAIAIGKLGMGMGMTRKMSDKGDKERERERERTEKVVLSVLGEGVGSNVPRRARK